MDNLISSFSENILDLSINEASVQWLGHSQIQTGSVYTELSSEFVNKTTSFYDQAYQGIFSGSSIQWKDFLLGDLRYVRRIVKE